MRTIGNILWIIFATLAFWPFGKEIVYGNGTWKPQLQTMSMRSVMCHLVL